VRSKDWGEGYEPVHSIPYFLPCFLKLLFRIGERPLFSYFEEAAACHLGEARHLVMPLFSYFEDTCKITIGISIL
jgi:hypothetical protein